MTDSRQPDTVDIIVGAKLRVLRLEKCVSQEALGDACGVTFQQVQKYESGMSRISMSRAVKIAQHLEVHPTFFLEGFGDCERAGFVSENLTFIASRLGVQLAMATKDLTPTQFKAIVEMARAMSSQDE